MLVTSILHGPSSWDGCCVLSPFSVFRDMRFIDIANWNMELLLRLETRDFSTEELDS